MSFHQIENIIEDAVVIVAKANISINKKRDLFFNLYQFQDRFDTSYTRFRVSEILETNQFLYATSLDNHPDFLTHPSFFTEYINENYAWIPVNILDEDGDTVLLENKQLFFEAGDGFWKRIKSTLPQKEQQEPQKIPYANLFYQLLIVAKEQNEILFLKRWYAFFVNSILEYELHEDDGIPPNFPQWLSQKSLSNIRDFIKANLEILNVKDIHYKNDEFLSLPKLKKTLSPIKDPNQKAKVNFLLSIKSSTSEIEEQYLKETSIIPDIAKYKLIYTFFRERLDANWNDGVFEIGTNEGCISFLSQKKHLYVCLLFEYISEINCLDFKIGIQYKDILQWQDRPAGATLELQHFTELLQAFCTDEEIMKNSHIGNWCVWKYDTKHTEKTLIKRLENIWELYQKLSPKILRFHTAGFDKKWLNITNSKKLMQKRKSYLNKGFRFFGNEMEFKLAIACANYKKDYLSVSKAYSLQVQELLNLGLGSDDLKKRIQQGLEYVQNNKGTYPEITHR